MEKDNEVKEMEEIINEDDFPRARSPRENKSRNPRLPEETFYVYAEDVVETASKFRELLIIISESKFFGFSIAMWNLLFMPWLRIPIFLMALCVCCCEPYSRYVRSNIPYMCIYLVSGVYGLFISYADCEYEWPCFVDLSSRSHVYLFFAKTSVRTSTIFLLCSLIISIRSFSSKIDSIPRVNSYSFDWRHLHVKLMLHSYFFAAGHIVAHIMRYNDDHYKDEPHPDEYVLFFTITGSILTFVFVFQAFTLISRWLFRRFHWMMSMIIPVIYFIHSSSYAPLFFLLIYWLDYQLHKEVIRDMEIVEGIEKNEIILRFGIGPNIPNTPGFYYQISVNNFMASYTFIPDGEYAIFHVTKDSVVANQCLNLIKDRKFYSDNNYRIFINNPSSRVGLWGPFDSNDYLSRQELSKCYITSGTGRSIQYDSYSHRKNVKTKTKIVYFHHIGPKKPQEFNKSEETLSDWTDRYDTISVEHAGSFDVNFLKDIFSNLHPKGFHFIFSGSFVVSVLDLYLQEHNMEVGNDRIHVESFSSDFTLIGSTPGKWGLWRTKKYSGDNMIV